jgi:hypothetical protein
MARFDEAMAFLLGPCVTLYTNAERSERRGAGQGDAPPRSDDELLDLLEKLARKYARPVDPMESYGPRRYPRC